MDYFFLEKDLATLKTTVLILEINKNQLFACKDIYEINKIFDLLLHNFQDQKEFKKLYNGFYINPYIFNFVQNHLIDKEKGRFISLVIGKMNLSKIQKRKLKK